jgi:hypothetical protein
MPASDQTNRRAYSVWDHTKRLLGQDIPAYAAGIAVVVGTAAALGIENPIVLRKDFVIVASQVDNNREALVRIELATSETLLIEKRKQLLENPNDQRLRLEVESLETRTMELRRRVYGDG